MKPLALFAVLVLAVLGLANPATADPVPVITWPEAKAFNPDVAPYTITVDDADGAGTLYADWQGERQALPHQGAVVLDLPQDGQGTVLVFRCEDTATCAFVAESPVLSVYRQLHVNVASVGIKATTAYVNVSVPDFAGASGSMTWRLLAKGTTDEVASGTSPFNLAADGTDRVELVRPSDLDFGDYVLEVELTADIDGYGTLTGSAAHAARVDGAHATVSVNRPVVYPAHDGYFDTVRIVVDFAEPIYGGVVAVDDLAGNRVAVIRQQDFRNDWVLNWTGEEKGRALPDGRYRIRVTGVDRDDYPLDISTPIRVSDKKLTWAPWARTFSAQSTITDTLVGSCSQLRRPAARGWSGSLGFYSQTSCTRPAQSTVATLNGIYLPKNLSPRYQDFRVTVNGGAARGARGAYLVLGYFDQFNNFVHRVQFDGSLGAHAGHYAMPSTLMHRDADRRKYILWQVGLSEGSRYDVKSFTVEVTRRVLR